jgi:hypothetical protein
MRSLCTIKSVGVLISPIRWSVCSGIGAFCGFAIVASVDGVVRVKEEGRGRGEKHPSATALH